jgi:hypothetical protein
MLARLPRVAGPHAARGARAVAAMACLLGAAAAVGCGGGESSPSGPDSAPTPQVPGEGAAPPTARLDLVRDLLADLEARRHPADGGGRAWLERDPAGAATTDAAAGPIVAGSARSFRFVYETGPLGVAEGGTVVFHPSPYWGWSPPQTSVPDAPGYTETRTDAPGVRLEVQAFPGAHQLVVAIRGRALRAGERVLVHYGTGPAAARVDRFAEREQPFFFRVDGDGDGVGEIVADAPAVDIEPCPPERVLLWLPSSARPGETVRATVALVDGRGNAGAPSAGALRLAATPGLRAPATLELAPEDRGRRHFSVEVVGEGVHHLRAEGPEGLAAESNPMIARADAPVLLWGDLHGHSNWSDGTGLPDDYFVYARDVAALDVVALTDHDHWGIPFLDRSPERWEAIRAATDRFHEPGRFVTVLGYEWTSWIHGHRHVLYFDGVGEVLSSIDPRYDAPDELWDALRGRPVLTFAHHSAGGPVATDWSFAPDPELEPVTEIVSVHGSSEAPDSPIPIYDPVAGNWVRDALDRGYRLGFVGSGDSHDGHPGLPQLAAPSGGGLAAIWAEARTREAVLEALRARRAYATNGPRIWLQVGLEGQRMGATVSARALEEAVRARGAEGPELAVRVAAPAPIARIDVIEGGRVVSSAPGEGRRELALHWVAPPLPPGGYLYVRVVQEDDGAAWSSPFFVTE